MATTLAPEEFVHKLRSTPAIDVRSPGEFQTGHIPGAINIPIFNNEERAIVGTIYKKESREPAVFKGLEIVGAKLRGFAEQARSIAKNNELLIYCWRGGMRSASMAWLFETIGIKCYTLEGGYKAFRRFGKYQLTKGNKLIILGGYTGSGKTAILQELVKQGEQVLDLESIANHKGSAFGALGQNKQPPNEQFENLLIWKWISFDLSKPIWLEDESKSIGANWIPQELYDRMRKATVINILLDNQSRIERLMKEYAVYDTKHLENCILKIEKRLGGQNTKEALESLKNDDLATVAKIALSYYDKTYRYGLEKREKHTVFPIKLESDNPKENATKIINFILAHFSSLPK